VTKGASALAAVLNERLAPSLVAMSFAVAGHLRWRRDGLEVRVVIDSKARDPFRGGAFTLEFERSDDGEFEAKLAGRSRVDQMLDTAQKREFLSVRNEVASRLPRPTDQHLAAIPPSAQREYLRAFAPAEELEPRFWMRFANTCDLEAWVDLLQRVMPDLVARAERLDPHALVLGRTLTW